MGKKNIKYAIKIFVLLCILFNISPNIKAVEDDVEIVVYHTGDIHGQGESVYSGTNLTKIGFDMIKSIKDSTPNSVLVDSGDAIFGTYFSRYSEGLDIINLMNLVGYDLMALGSSEISFGLDSFFRCLNAANFPILSSNVYMNEKPLLNQTGKSNGQNSIIEIAGKKVGFFGLTTEETRFVCFSPDLKNIFFKDEIEAAKSEVKKLKQQNVDAIVALAHIGDDLSSKITNKEIAKKVPGIDVIIDAYSHKEYIFEENSVLITQTGAGLANLGKINIKFSKNKPKKIKASLISANEIGKTINPDSKITRIYRNLKSKIGDFQDTVIGKVRNNLYGSVYNNVDISNISETNMGNFVCDAMLDSGKKLLENTENSDLCVVSLINGKSICGSIKSGYIKMDQVYSLFPSDRKIYVKVITPKTLYQLLEEFASKITFCYAQNECATPRFSCFPHVSGVEIEIDPYAESYDYSKNLSGKRITNIKINSGGKISEILSRDDDKSRIALIFSDDLMYNFASYDLNSSTSGDYLYDVVANYIKTLTYKNFGEFSYPYFDKRVKIHQKNLKQTFDSEITLKDETGKLSLVPVELTIDGNDPEYFRTDENAKIELKSLSSGPHIVKLKYCDKFSEIYINNEIGLKNGAVEFFDEFNSEVESVSNIIGQISYDITDDYENLVIFAQNSYRNLNDLQKTKILNYNKLKQAEEKVRLLNNNSDPMNIITKLGSDKAALTITSAVIFVVGASIIIYLKQKFKKSLDIFV